MFIDVSATAIFNVYISCPTNHYGGFIQNLLGGGDNRGQDGVVEPFQNHITMSALPPSSLVADYCSSFIVTAAFAVANLLRADTQKCQLWHHDVVMPYLCISKSV